MKFATQHPKYAGLVVMPDGSTETKAAAIEQGFTVNAHRAVSRSGSTVISGTSKVEHDPQLGASSPQAIYRSTIMALPEAIGRHAAADQLASEHNASTLSPASAASILRGLPLETTAKEAVSIMATELSVEDHAVFRRACDFRMMALHKTATKTGKKADQLEAFRFSTALQFYDKGDMSFGAAATKVGLDARATIVKVFDFYPPTKT